MFKVFITEPADLSIDVRVIFDTNPITRLERRLVINYLQEGQPKAVYEIQSGGSYDQAYIGHSRSFSNNELLINYILSVIKNFAAINVNVTIC
jgi:hypothetical protein